MGQTNYFPLDLPIVRFHWTEGESQQAHGAKYHQLGFPAEQACVLLVRGTVGCSFSFPLNQPLKRHQLNQRRALPTVCCSCLFVMLIYVDPALRLHWLHG